MADIAGIGGGSGLFGFNPTRSAPEETQAPGTRERVEDDAQRAAEAEDASLAAGESAPASVAGAESDQDAGNEGQGQELTEDTVTLSAGAEQALTGVVANDVEPDAPAAGEANLIASDTRSTNQSARQEDTTAEVNGNQNSQSETTRTLGQVVDQFA
ncbi:MAG: hypothetical protein NXI21_13885 [Alphaproteobacteria bacterium]|nr:hypothetical protein [Alphaproteobacteria bacterium]